jgi:predicted Zn-dependent protease
MRHDWIKRFGGFMVRSKILALILALVVGAIWVPSARAVMLISKDDEVKIGKQVEQESIKQYGGLSTDQALIQRVARVGKTVAVRSPRQDVTYTYKVLNSNIINAFAAPGGPILITKKLVKMLPTDDELAFVLAHETGHVTAQHGRKAINQALMAQGAFSLLLGKSSQAAKVGVNIMYTLYDRGYSREQEYQADSYGAEFMKAAGYNPEGAIKALAKLGMDRQKGVNKYLATHPDIPDRITRIGQMTGISQQRQQELTREATGK